MFANSPFRTRRGLPLLAVSALILALASCKKEDETSTATVDTSSCDALSGDEKLVCLTEALSSSMSSSQLAKLQISRTKTAAAKWTNLPGGSSNRNGVEFSEMSESQQSVATSIIALASGTAANEGADEFSQIRKADDYLSNSASGYGSGEYILAFLDAPSTTGTWMLQFGGHHYAQNVTFTAGAAVSATPSHQGVEPISFTTDGTTYAPLAQEKAGMAEMLASFTSSELASAKLSTTFGDVLLGPGKDGQFPSTKSGVRVGDLSSTTQAKVLAAMMPWLDDLRDDIRKTLLDDYTADLADTYVAYSKNASSTSGNAASFFTASGDYVRIDGPNVWIEFVCQNGAVLSGIHYHAVFRDHVRDYAGL